MVVRVMGKIKRGRMDRKHSASKKGVASFVVSGNASLIGWHLSQVWNKPCRYLWDQRFMQRKQQIHRSIPGRFEKNGVGDSMAEVD